MWNPTPNEGYKSGQYSSLLKIDKAGDLLPPCEAKHRLGKFVVMITRPGPRLCIIYLFGTQTVRVLSAHIY